MQTNQEKNLVFIHGWGLSKTIWQPFCNYLENDFKTWTLDLPGFGEEKIEQPMDLKDYAEFLKDFLEKNKIEQPIILGHSFGGAVAAKLALLYPEKISKLILVSAALIRKQNLRVKILGKSGPYFKKIMPKKIKNYLLKILDLQKSDYAAITNPLLKETFKKIIKEDFENDLKLVQIPTLIIWGEKDALTPLSEGKLINKLMPQSKLEILDGEHFIFLDQPQDFVKLIKDFGI